MMAGYLRELLADYSLCNTEDMGNAIGTDWHLTKILIQESLKSLLETSQIGQAEVYALRTFFIDSTEKLIFLQRPNAVELLRKSLTVLENATGLTDEDFIRHALESRPTLKPIEAALVRKLIEKGNEF